MKTSLWIAFPTVAFLAGILLNVTFKWKIINRTCINCKKTPVSPHYSNNIVRFVRFTHSTPQRQKNTVHLYYGAGKSKTDSMTACLNWQHCKVWTPFKLFDLIVKVWQKTQTMTPNSHARQLTKVFFNTEIAIFLMRNLSIYILMVNVSQISNVNLWILF